MFKIQKQKQQSKFNVPNPGQMMLLITAYTACRFPVVWVSPRSLVNFRAHKSNLKMEVITQQLMEDNQEAGVSLRLDYEINMKTGEIKADYDKYKQYMRAFKLAYLNDEIFEMLNKELRKYLGLENNDVNQLMQNCAKSNCWMDKSKGNFFNLYDMAWKPALFTTNEQIGEEELSKNYLDQLEIIIDSIDNTLHEKQLTCSVIDDDLLTTKPLHSTAVKNLGRKEIYETKSLP